MARRESPGRATVRRRRGSAATNRRRVGESSGPPSTITPSRLRSTGRPGAKYSMVAGKPNSRNSSTSRSAAVGSGAPGRRPARASGVSTVSAPCPKNRPSGAGPWVLTWWMRARESPAAAPILAKVQPSACSSLITARRILVSSLIVCCAAATPSVAALSLSTLSSIAKTRATSSADMSEV
ncbi:Uncharacterised protein [Mycobacteroides abscessus subsp. abscessus]|nr:Uncharacterised protein [Mycobacteroides abscessus subsp. abscessus]